jgi:hypothetical protein
MPEPFFYKGYRVEYTNSDYSYVVKKDNKVVLVCEQKFPFPPEAEVDAKLRINRLEAQRDGWIIS